jgi:hypothetical protein
MNRITGIVQGFQDLLLRPKMGFGIGRRPLDGFHKGNLRGLPAFEAALEKIVGHPYQFLVLGVYQGDPYGIAVVPGNFRIVVIHSIKINAISRFGNTGTEAYIGNLTKVVYYIKLY